GVKKIILDDLVGKSVDDVKKYVEENNLIVDYKEEYSDTMEKGKIISQSPESFTKLKKGANISVVVSQGKKENPVKTVEQNIRVPYVPSNPNEPQEVEIYIEDTEHTMDKPADTRKITETIDLT